MHISYNVRNGIEYATLVASRRSGKTVVKDYTWLGRVLDRERGIYRSRKRGVFTYDLATDTYGSAPAESVAPATDIRRDRELMTLDFGDAFFLDWFIRTKGLLPAIDATGYGGSDTLYAMIHYYTTCSMANEFAQIWWEGSYVRILYPEADLSDQRIHDFLCAIGDEYSHSEFFKEYFRIPDGPDTDTENILIDSTGHVNSKRFPVTALSNYYGDISDGIRLLYVIRKKTGYPLYFRYCPGDMIDSMPLIRCFEKLQEEGINVTSAILDADYYLAETVRDFFEKRIPFLIQLEPDQKLFTSLARKHLDSLESEENLVKYNDRDHYLKCVPVQFHGNNAYACIGLDIGYRLFGTDRVFQQAEEEVMSAGQLSEVPGSPGVFILVSSHRVAPAELLPLYFTKAQIGRVFGMEKSDADMLPVHVQSEKAFQGHLLLTFIAAVIRQQLQDSLSKTDDDPAGLFLNLRNQKCTVFADRIVVSRPYRKASSIYRKFRISSPAVIPRKP